MAKTGETRRRPGIARKLTSCVCATALALSLGAMVPLDRIAPDRFDGGTAYAASVKAGSLATGTTAKTKASSVKAASTATLLRAGTYRITSVASSSLAVDVPSGTWDNNKQLQLWSVNNMTPQTYVFAQTGTNVFTIQSACSGKFLADSGGKVVQQSRSSSSLYQRWQVVKEGSNLALKNVKTGRMLATSSVSRYAKLVTRPQRSNSYEQWRFTATNLIPNGTYQLGSALGNNQMLDVSGAGTANCTNVQIWANNGLNPQKWQVTHVGNGYYKLINAASGKALDINRNTCNVQQYTYVANEAAELWKAEVSDKGGYVFVNKLNGRLLDVYAARNASGTNVWVYPRNGADAQRWLLYSTTKIQPGSRYVNAGISVREITDYAGAKTISIPNGTYVVRNAMGRYLDVSASSMDPGANVQIWSGNGANAQKWKIASVGGGYYTFESVCSGYSLDVVNGRNVNGTNVRQWYGNGSGAQRWKAELVGNSLVFVNECTGKALDVSACRNADGTNVQIWDRNDCNAQRWTLVKTVSNPQAYQNVARDVFDAYNNYRASRGLNRVGWDENCANIALQSCRNCSARGALQHRTAIAAGSNLSDILRYATWKESGQEAVDKWKTSTGHDRMMRCPSTTKAGVGVWFDGTRYWYTIVYNFSGCNQARI